ncbi:Uma2 family endonuclease [Streptomyces antarcticus]|uniref:Uma2 family endonuclease n=1 Tax=Streptomyces antarcticus TaxID=2996458 RepID=UPI00226F8DBE|nr:MULTISPECIES: Uma2 family endonuclease [unclassified Streptomyces]MCY0946768.1 Uma2 family endonuclease [Streptomyces sp. H34-AA3]MCY0948386.1 Uma2 family endonuclease [Streptomyces sp. H27-S2]MCZ4085403.1 Uma2 family endonuclease [Streptomyces sp. H34-S5]
MTAMIDRPHMLTEEFEAVARIAARETEGTRLEFIDGVLRSKAVPDGDHGMIIQWLTRICMQHRPELWLHPGQGLKVEQYRAGRAIPDAVLAPAGAFAGQGEWVAPDPALMVVEVTSWDSDTDRRDRIEKPRAYAETGIPVYLLIDRDKCEISLHTEPEGGRYLNVRTVPYGMDVGLPEPVGITLRTEPLKDWVR